MEYGKKSCRPDTGGSRSVFRGLLPAHAHSCAATFSLKSSLLPNTSTLPLSLRYSGSTLRNLLKTRPQCFPFTGTFLSPGLAQAPLQLTLSLSDFQYILETSSRSPSPSHCSKGTRDHITNLCNTPAGPLRVSRYFFNFFPTSSWRYVLKLIFPSLFPKKAGGENQHSNLMTATQWFLKHVQRMKETGWVSSTSLGCGSTWKSKQTKITTAMLSNTTVEPASKYMTAVKPSCSKLLLRSPKDF